MKTTTNLGLHLYEATDKFSITAESSSLNSNMNILDTAIGSLTQRLFIGTQAEYETAYKAGEIPNGALVVITDDSIPSSSSTTAKLGEAVLGQMVLGNT